MSKRSVEASVFRLAMFAGAVFFGNALAVPAMAQAHASTGHEQAPAEEGASRERLPERAEADGVFATERDSEARVALEQWAGCVARDNRSESGRVLTMDFTTKTYERALKSLADEGRSCVKFRGKMRSAGLLFAGEMAEALIEADGRPVVSQLAYAAGTPATIGYSFTDKVAICVVRSVPDQIAALFVTERDSTEEFAAIETLAVPTRLCAQVVDEKRKLSVSPAGLRAMLATAAYRSINAPGGQA